MVKWWLGWVVATGFLSLPFCLSAEETRDWESLTWEPLTLEEARTLLPEASRAARATREAIRTWSGRGTIFLERNPTSAAVRNLIPLPEGSQRDDPDLRMQEYVSVQFWCDLAGDRLFTKYAPMRRFVIDTSSGAMADDTQAWYERWTLVVPGAGYYFRPGERPGEFRADPRAAGWSPYSSRIVRKKQRAAIDAQMELGEVADPRIGLQVGGTLYDREFTTQLSLMERETRGRTVEVAGPSQRFIRLTSDIKSLRFSSIFDRDCNYQAIRYQQWDLTGGAHQPAGRLVDPAEAEFTDEKVIPRSDVHVRYVYVDDVCVPDQVDLQDCNPAGEPILRRIFTIEEARVNQPIDDAQLSLAAFDLHAGDRVMDEEVGQLFVVGTTGELVTPIEFETQLNLPRAATARAEEAPPAAARSRSWLSILLINSMLILGVVLGWWRFGRRTGNPE